jgi:hypothetical protein
MENGETLIPRHKQITEGLFPVYSPQDAAKDKLHDFYLNVQKHKNNFSKKAPDRTAEAGNFFFFLLEVHALLWGEGVE